MFLCFMFMFYRTKPNKSNKEQTVLRNIKHDIKKNSEIDVPNFPLLDIRFAQF